MIPYPADFIAEIEVLLEESASQFWDELKHQPPRAGLRGNPLKISSETLRSLLPVPLVPIPWEENGFQIPGSASLGRHPFHAAGLFYLQEPSAMAAVEVLQPQPGECILDLAAAPGGKATQIASRMENQGLLLANDPHAGRVQALARNLERWGVRHTAVTRDVPERLADQLGPIFDRVLVDAPCSGEGMFRSHPGERKQWSSGFVRRCAAKQQEILWHAARLVKKGGVLVYATCTFNRMENEEVVMKFLEAREDYCLEHPPDIPGASPGTINRTRKDPLDEQLLRIWPHLAPGEGHFIARFRKSSSRSAQPRPKTVPNPILTDQDRAMYADFFNKTLVHSPTTRSIQPDSPNLGRFGNRLYAIPPRSPRLNGLKVHHWGWWVGTFQGERFSPSHALAMGIRPEDSQKVIEFSVDGPAVHRYLRGLPSPSPGDEGWVLVTTSGFPVGWGKRSGGQLKSSSPSWLQ